MKHYLVSCIIVSFFVSCQLREGHGIRKEPADCTTSKYIPVFHDAYIEDSLIRFISNAKHCIDKDFITSVLLENRRGTIYMTFLYSQSFPIALLDSDENRVTKLNVWGVAKPEQCVVLVLSDSLSDVSSLVNLQSLDSELIDSVFKSVEYYQYSQPSMSKKYKLRNKNELELISSHFKRGSTKNLSTDVKIEF